MTSNASVRNILVASLGFAVFAMTPGCASQGVGGGKPHAVETYVKGVYAYQDGKKDEAVATLKQAIEANPELIMPRVLLGRIYKLQGDYKASAEQYEVLTRVDPYNIENHYQLGVDYQLIQRLRDAAASYRNAMKLDPNDFGSNMNLGLVYLAMGDVDNAVRYTDKAAQLRPGSAEAQANLAVALDSRGDYALAEKAYRKSLELAPLQAGTLTNYGNNLIAQQKWTDAVQVFGEVLKKQDTPYLHKRMGDAYAIGGRYDQALAEYQRAIKANPKYVAAMNEQARVMILQYQQGMELNDRLRDDALGIWRQSLALSPEQPKVKASLEDWEKRMFSK